MTNVGSQWTLQEEGEFAGCSLQVGGGALEGKYQTILHRVLQRNKTPICFQWIFINVTFTIILSSPYTYKFQEGTFLYFDKIIRKVTRQIQFSVLVIQNVSAVAPCLSCRSSAVVVVQTHRKMS